MEEKINQTNYDRDIKVCVMRGFYDCDDEYREEYKEDINLLELPKKAIDRIDFTYDVSTLYAKDEVLVIAPNMQAINEYKELGGTPRLFHALLNLPDDNYWDDGYMCIFSDLKTLRRWKMKRK